MLANRTLLLQSDMVAAMPYQVVQTYEQVGLLVQLPITLKTPPGPIGVTLRKNRELSPAANYLLDKMREVAEEIKANQPEGLLPDDIDYASLT